MCSKSITCSNGFLVYGSQTLSYSVSYSPRFLSAYIRKPITVNNEDITKAFKTLVKCWFPR